VAQRQGSEPLEERRLLEIGEAFGPTLHRLGITTDASDRRAVGRVVGRLDHEALPGPDDVLTRIFHAVPSEKTEVDTLTADTAWSRRVVGRSLWVLYQFDEHVVKVLAVTREPPIQLGIDE
jgi:hypothetical protein